jgi:DNA-binding protein YbaB
VFDKLKAMGAVASLMKDKEKLREIGARIKRRAEETRASGEAGSGAVRVTVNGQMKVLEVELTPALVAGMAADERTRQLAGSLIADAVNHAIATSQNMMKSVIDQESRELGLGDLGESIGGLLK